MKRGPVKRGLLTRRIATAILVSFAGLLLVALAPLFYDGRMDGGLRHGIGVLASQADNMTISHPVSLSTSPDIVISAGTLSASRASQGSGRSIAVAGATLEVRLGADAAALPTGADPVGLIFTPLVEQLASLDVDKITLRRSSLVLKWGKDQTTKLENIDAEITTKHKSVVAASGQFNYLGQTLTFDALTGPAQIRGTGEGMIPATLDKSSDSSPGQGSANAASRWPLQLNVRSPLLTVSIDGSAVAAGAWSLKAQTEIRTPDTARLAAWLGYRASTKELGPALLIKGPARWSDGAISFGKSQVSLSDQEAVGALSLSMRDNRPLIEATLAFPALDVSPLLHAATSTASNTAPEQATWRSLATTFPAAGRMDAEFRISASRLQWNGTPVGKGAVSISARGGRVHADLAELDLGAHKGNLQIMIGEAAAGAPVSLRGKFYTADIAPLASQLFGTSIVRGRTVSNFDITGRGATLGEVIDGAGGRGHIAVYDGQMQIDLNALQKLAQTPNKTEPIGGWGTAAALSPFESLDVKFQLRDGSVTIEQASARSRGLLASAQGRIGLANPDLDMWVRVTPSTGATSGSGLGPSRSVGTSSRTQIGGPREMLAIRGSWSAPMLVPADTDPAP